MTAEDRTQLGFCWRTPAQVKVIAEGHGTLTERLDQFKPEVEHRFERIEVRLDLSGTSRLGKRRQRSALKQRKPS